MNDSKVSNKLIMHASKNHLNLQRKPFCVDVDVCNRWCTEMQISRACNLLHVCVMESGIVLCSFNERMRILYLRDFTNDRKLNSMLIQIKTFTEKRHITSQVKIIISSKSFKTKLFFLSFPSNPHFYTLAFFMIIMLLLMRK